MNGNTKAVQSFIRFIAFFLTFTILGFFLLLFATIGLSFLMIPVGIFNLWVSSVVASMFYILPEWQKIVILRLGKFESVRGAGFFVIPPFIYSVAAILDTRIETNQVEATATLTKDNVPTKVTAAVEYRVEDPKKAILDVQDYRFSVTWLSTEALKNTIGSLELKELLSNRDEIAKTLREQIDQGAAAYGVDVKAVRITDIDTPPSLVEELAIIARARRSSEAKQIIADAEILVAKKIAEASKHLVGQVGGMKLRELQALAEMSKEGGTTVIVYPYDDPTGTSIANSAAGQQVGNQFKPPKNTE